MRLLSFVVAFVVFVTLFGVPMLWCLVVLLCMCGVEFDTTLFLSKCAAVGILLFSLFIAGIANGVKHDSPDTTDNVNG